MTLNLDPNTRGPIITRTLNYTRTGTGSLTVAAAVPWQSALIIVEAVSDYTCRGIVTANYENGGADVDIPLCDRFGTSLGVVEFVAPGVYSVDLRGVTNFRIRSTSSSHGWKVIACLSPDPLQFNLSPKGDARTRTELISLGDVVPATHQFTGLERFASARMEVSVPSNSIAPDNFRVGFRRDTAVSGSGTRYLPIYRENGVWHDHLWPREAGAAYMVDLTSVQTGSLVAEAGHYASVLITFSEDRFDPKPLASDVGSSRSVIVSASSTSTQGYFSGFQVLEAAVLDSVTSYSRKTRSEASGSRLYPVSGVELPIGHFEPGPFDTIRLTSGKVRAYIR
jgi:hypothetical protein